MPGWDWQPSDRQERLPGLERQLAINGNKATGNVFMTRARAIGAWLDSKSGASADAIGTASNKAIRPPLALNVLKHSWPAGPYDAIYSANTAHIMPWTAVQAMFKGAAACLGAGGMFCLYGPFRIDGHHNSPGNEEFDRTLRTKNPERGLRDIVELESLAASHHLKLRQRIPMPANNFLLVFEKQVG